MGSFKGSDTTHVELDAELLGIVGKLLEQTTFAGVHLPVANSLDVLFTNPVAGVLEMSHDQIALLIYVIDRSAFDRAARPRALALRNALQAAHDSFYQRTNP